MSYVQPVLLGLLAAAAWGAADFTGGLASRRANVYRVVIGAEFVGVILLIPIAIIFQEALPPFKVIIIAAAAGFAGGFGLILLYRAFATGQMSIAAPVSALGGALIPVLAGSLLEGFPDANVIAGISLALISIFLVARAESGQNTGKLQLDQLKLPGLAGILFGVFFILLHQSSQEGMLWPVAAVRISSILLLTTMAATTHQIKTVNRKLIPLIVLTGLLDTGGNIFYVIAGQLGRLDIAAVLSSLYPAFTIALAYILLKERISPIQWIGVLMAFIAIILIVI